MSPLLILPVSYVSVSEQDFFLHKLFHLALEAPFFIPCKFTLLTADIITNSLLSLGAAGFLCQEHYLCFMHPKGSARKKPWL